MAEAMLLGVAKSVVGQLSSPALKEALLLWNFEKNLKRLGETIETITCVIHDAEQRQSNQHAVKLWLSRLKAVLYEADDLFDAIAARALRKKAIGGSTIKKEADENTDEVYAQITLFPELRDMTREKPSQELVAEDLHGFSWYFKHVLTGNPKRHVLTTGWKRFAKRKGVVAGDSFHSCKSPILSRLNELYDCDRGENGKLHVGVRHTSSLRKTTP